MTNRELNNKIKKFYWEVEDKANKLTVDDWFNWVGSEATKKQFYALCYADDTFTSLTAESIKMLIVLNRRHRFMPLHHFGVKIEIKPR